MIPPMLNIPQIFVSVDFVMLIISPKTNNLLASNFAPKMGGILDQYFLFICQFMW